LAKPQTSHCILGRTQKRLCCSGEGPKIKTAYQVLNVIINRLKPIKNTVRTLNYDNGKEFVDHATIDKTLVSVSYFADLYSSWQRESNENLNGLIRQYVPKSRPLSTLSDQELARIESMLNNSPRKRLGFKKPY